MSTQEHARNKNSKIQQAILTVALALLLALGIVPLQACSTESEAPQAQDPEQAAPAVSSDEMAERTIIDAAGRSVTIPGVGALERIYFTSATAEIFCISLAPDLSGGTTYELSADELRFLPAEMANLSFLGTTSGNKQLNLEAIMAEGIQVIFSTSFDAPNERDVSDADAIQQQTGIPVILMNGALEESANTYRFLGEVLGRVEDAEELAAYCEITLKNVTNAVATIPDSERITLYYAEGSDGLQTEPDTSPHALIFKLAGAHNVAQVEANQGMGMSDVSLEQVTAWDPEVIIVWSYVLRGGAENTIRSDNAWASIQAVRDGRVYAMPNAPFSWCDRPPVSNRLLGLQWIANMLYPDAYDVDMVEVTKDFYSLFYHVNITDAEAKELLGNSYPVYQG